MRFPTHWFIPFLLSAVAIIMVATPVRAASDDLKGFWKKDDVKNYNSSVTPNSSQEVVYHDYPRAVDRAKEAAKAAALEMAAEEVNSALPQQAQTAPKATTPQTRDEIIARFGDSEEPEPVQAQKDAPPEMGGLIAALNIGDKELAWKYATKLAKRQVAVNTTVTKATEYQLLAMEALGMRRPSSLDPDRDYIGATRAELQPLMEQTRHEQLQRRIALDPTLLEGEDEASGSPATTARAAVELETTSDIPVDPQGKVKLLVFFDEKSSDAKQIVDLLRPLRETFKANRNISIIGLTMRTYAPQGLKYRGAELSFPFPLINGEALALNMRIERYPTFVFMAVTSRQSHRIEGMPSALDLESTLRVMSGEKK